MIVGEVLNAASLGALSSPILYRILMKFAPLERGGPQLSNGAKITKLRSKLVQLWLPEDQRFPPDLRSIFPENKSIYFIP